MRIAGAISGTSHDGIDVAVVDLDLDGDLLAVRLLAESSTPYSDELRAELVAALPPAATTLEAVTRLDTLIGQEFAAALRSAVEGVGGVELISSHGQTVYHWVDGGVVRGSLQLGEPAWIAEATGIPVLADLRMRDVAAGGQGAPIVPLLDRLLLADRPGTAALNLGGISNLTLLRDGDALAWDIGPANALIDAVVRAEDLHPAGYDADGAIAATGRVDEELLALLLDEPYYALPAPKSTGKELFHGGYVAERVARLGRPVAPADLVATLTELTILTVADAVRAMSVAGIVVSGGGCRNRTMMAGLERALPGVVVSATDVLGIPSDAKEAIAVALIGWFGVYGLAGSVPTATGAREARILGSLNPGGGPLTLPTPLPSAPSRLVVLPPEGA